MNLKKADETTEHAEYAEKEDLRPTRVTAEMVRQAICVNFFHYLGLLRVIAVFRINYLSAPYRSYFVCCVELEGRDSLSSCNRNAFASGASLSFQP